MAMMISTMVNPPRGESDADPNAAGARPGDLDGESMSVDQLPEGKDLQRGRVVVLR